MAEIVTRGRSPQEFYPKGYYSIRTDLDDLQSVTPSLRDTALLSLVAIDLFYICHLSLVAWATI